MGYITALIVRVALPALLAFAGTVAAEPDPQVLLEAEQKGEPIHPAFDTDEFAEEREAMVAEQIEARDISDPDVLGAMGRVPRHRFAPDVAPERAYADSPHPIGHGQTISQPYIVAYMTELLQLEPDDRVLEVGTGSAYQAAVLAEVAGEVVTIEIIPELAESAANRLKNLGYTNVTALSGDGYYGYEPKAPYDAIIVTAAAEHTPPPLVEQLQPGGRMVIPVGRGGWTQNLLLVEKDAEGEVSTRNLMSVRFVPLTGDH
jgi:protein-L-isoaspartate(D-aspartate) O-methyltransferase